jgi:hypothetical protein
LISAGLKIASNVKLTFKFDSLTDHVQNFADFSARVASKKPPSHLGAHDFFPEARILSAVELLVVENCAYLKTMECFARSFNANLAVLTGISS